MATPTFTRPASERNHATVERLMAVVVQGWHTADDRALARTAWELEALPASPLVEAMRAYLVAEQAIRAADRAIRSAQPREPAP